MRDVAEAAGVAQSTVSHVFNRTAPISPETEARVLEAARRLGFEPRQRRQRKSTLVGLLLYGIGFERRARVIMGALQVLKAQGARALIATCDSAMLEDMAENTTVDAFAREAGLKEVQGVIVVTEHVGDLTHLQPGALPAVFCFGHSERSSLPSVIPDSFQGARDAMRHLIQMGHRMIAFINGPADSKSSRDREEGYQVALAEAGIPFEPRLVSNGTWKSDDGYKRARALLESGLEFTAVFGGNDQLAIGAMDALREHGLRVPEDVAVVGFDDSEAASIVRPPLTTVKLPLHEIGGAAAQMLLERIHDAGSKNGEKHDASNGVQSMRAVFQASLVYIPCPLVVRASCGSKSAG